MTRIDGPLGVQGVLAMRARILEKSEALRAAVQPAPEPTAAPSGFGAAMDQALKAVNALQGESSAAAGAYERGETHDIASVMLARQKASLAFEATLQSRNRLLTAYRDVMNMPV
jgi:flagellar hook-basal body complex protein FliE